MVHRATHWRLKEYDSCDIVTQLKTFTDIVVQTCTERLGIEERTEKKVVEKRPNRRQVQKGKLRTRERQLKKALQEAPDNEKPGINELLKDIHKQILTLSRAENHRKKEREKGRQEIVFTKILSSLLNQSSLKAKVGYLMFLKKIWRHI